MKAILINPEDGIVQTINITGKNIQEIYDIIGCTIFTSVYVSDGEGDQDESMFLDDEGLFEPVRYGWTYNNHQFVGKGLIVGVDKEGSSVSTKLKPINIIKKIKFMGRV